MKKWVAAVVAILVASFFLGASFRGRYTQIDFADKGQIKDFSVRLLTKEDLEETKDPTGAEHAKEAEVIVETLDPYTGEKQTEIQSVEDGKQDEPKEISWLEAWRSELAQAECVAEVSPVGGVENLAGTLQQQVKVEKAYRGELVAEGDTFFYISSLPIFIMLEEGNTKKWYIGNTYTNFMQEGKTYLVFLNSTNGKRQDLLYGASEKGISYFCLDEMKNNYKNKEDVFVAYQEVENVEFFCGDETVLECLMEIKKEMIEKYLPF
ncbi:hypothetical protein LQZ18_19040 [Lachnospiraceae bacterium ZAX-1]